MNVLVFNAKEDSLDYALFGNQEEVVISGSIGNFGSSCDVRISTPRYSFLKKHRIKDALDAAVFALKSLREYGVLMRMDEISAVGHRISHGGKGAVIINDAVVRKIKELSSNALAGILACRKVLPKIPQVAVFDSHTAGPLHHGTSHRYSARQAQKLLGKKGSRIITCHLDSQSSVSAMMNGNPLDASGPIAMEGDLQEMRTREKSGDEAAKRSLDRYARQIAFSIGGYIAIMAGADAIVFTAAVGESGWFMRNRILNYLSFLGVKYDVKANRKNQAIISADDSRIKVYVIPANEELQIARETKEMLKR
jgi:acetate kinase